MKTPAACTLALLLSASAAFAQAPADPAFYQIKNAAVQVTQLSAGADAALEKPAALTEPSSRNPALLVNIGAFAWKVIADGKPTTAASYSFASAMPPGMYNNWSSVAGWKGPREYLYTYTITNLMGVDVIKAKYKISYYYGGTEGADSKVKGRYLTNFTIKPVEVKVLWGWNFDLDVKISNPMNTGTPENPVGFLQADLNWKVSTPFKAESGIWSYTADGLGNFKDLDAEQKALTNAIPPLSLSDAPEISWN